MLLAKAAQAIESLNAFCINYLGVLVQHLSAWHGALLGSSTTWHCQDKHYLSSTPVFSAWQWMRIQHRLADVIPTVLDA